MRERIQEAGVMVLPLARRDAPGSLEEGEESPRRGGEEESGVEGARGGHRVVFFAATPNVVCAALTIAPVASQLT